MPLTRNGKVDRRSLPAPEQMATSYLAPRTPAEELMAGIWQEVLGLKQVSVNDNFFDLGGHSLLATQVFSRIREIFQLELPFRLIFESPTLAEFTAVVEEARNNQSESDTSPIVPVSRDAYRMQVSAEHLS
jgi:acyl carrier protein